MNRLEPKAAEILGLLWNFGWPIAAGVLLGGWLDRRLGTSPWLALFLALAAMIAGVRIILKVVGEDDKKDDDNP
ncbi:MAG: AtpZ/AtpI family protein [Candidatus Binatia bacterium]